MTQEKLPHRKELCLQSETGSVEPVFLYDLYYNDVGAKAPDFDTYGLLRATRSHNPTQYSHIVGL